MSFAAKFASTKGGANFTARIIKEKALVYDLRFPEGEREAYFILEVERAKHKDFKHALTQQAPGDLRDYGKILYSGYGEPAESIKAELREKFGMYEDS